MAAVEEARDQAGPAFYHELAEIWKFVLAFPSGIDFGEMPRVNNTVFKAFRMLLIFFRGRWQNGSNSLSGSTCGRYRPTSAAPSRTAAQNGK